MPWRRSSSLSLGSFVIGSGPLQVSPLPGPDQALGQQEDDEHAEERPRRQRGVRDRERQEEQHLDVKDQEKNRIEVVMSLELDPGVAGRGHAALVGVVFGLSWLAWLEEEEPG